MRLLYRPGEEWAAHEMWVPLISTLFEKLTLHTGLDLRPDHLPEYLDDAIRLRLSPSDQLTITTFVGLDRISWSRDGRLEVYSGISIPHHLWFITQRRTYDTERMYQQKTYWLDDGDIMMCFQSTATTHHDENLVLSSFRLELGYQIIDLGQQTQTLMTLDKIRKLAAQRHLFSGEHEHTRSILDQMIEAEIANLPPYLQNTIKPAASGEIDLAQAEALVLQRIRDPHLQEAYFYEKDWSLERVPYEEAAVIFERDIIGQDSLHVACQTYHKRRSIPRNFRRFFQSLLGARFVPEGFKNNTHGHRQKAAVLLDKSNPGELPPLVSYLTEQTGLNWIVAFIYHLDELMQIRIPILARLADSLPGPGTYVAYPDFNPLCIS